MVGGEGVEGVEGEGGTPLDPETLDPYTLQTSHFNYKSPYRV